MNAAAHLAPAAHGTHAPAAAVRASGFPASVLPELHRSEAFVEDLFDCSGFTSERPQAEARASRWHTVLLCAVPLLVALLGGALAFLHSVG